MSKIQEIESALKQLAAQEQWQIARWLLDQLEGGLDHTQKKHDPVSSLPDYAARRRRIFGDKVLPNLVMTARSEERW